MNITDQKSLIAAISKMSDEEKLNLTTLDLSHTQVSDVTPLAELKNLTILNPELKNLTILNPELKNLTILNP